MFNQVHYIQPNQLSERHVQQVTMGSMSLPQVIDSNHAAEGKVEIRWK